MQVLTLDKTGVTLELNTRTPVFTSAQVDGRQCQVASLEGVAQLEEPGWPVLPVQGALLGIPPDAQPTLEVLALEPVNLPGWRQLCPAAQPQLSLFPDQPLILSGYDYPLSPAYQVDAYLPAAPVELVETGNLRSQRFAAVRFNPLQYNPLSGAVRYYRRMRVAVKFNSAMLQAGAQAEAQAGAQAGAQAETQAETQAGAQANAQANSLRYINEGEFEQSLESLLVNYEQARGWRSQPVGDATMAPSYTQSAPAYKILVDQDGLYQLTYEQLQSAGLPVETLDPRTFRLFNQGSEVRIYIEGEENGAFEPGETLLFFGQKVNTRYTNTNVYWLTWGEGNGLRMEVVDGTPGGNAELPADFLTTLHLEQDSAGYYIDQPSGPDKDRWYWKQLYADAGSGAVWQDFAFNLERLGSPGERKITLRGLLKGHTSSSSHHVRLYLNGTLVDDHTFPEGSAYLFELSAIPATLLQEGSNTLRVELPSPIDLVLVNWFEIDYYRTYFADDDQLYFDGDQAGTWEYRLDGFSTNALEAFDISQPRAPQRVSGAEISSSPNGYQLAFEREIAGERHYLAQSRSQRRAVLSIQLDSPSSWKSPLVGADYIIISHANFLNALQPLAAYRASQGYRVQVVDVQDLYDEFNGGVFSPEAIRSFLQYAYASWQRPAPKFVLLVGDGNLDFKNVFGWNEANFIPPFLDDVDPWIGETATDNRYACVNGPDILPDLYIGRFPVRTPTEAQIMVQKALDYEQNPPQGGWNGRQFFVADNPDPAGNFPQQSEAIIQGYVPAAYAVERLYYNSASYTPDSARAALQAAVNQGQLLVHFAGHGSIQLWAAEGLLRVDDLPKLTNGDMLPFFIPMTCVEGYFVRPSPSGENRSSLGESLVRKDGGGAIASWSPSGYGLSAGHALLDESLFDHLFNQQQTQLGFLTTQPKYEMYAKTSAYNDLVETYLLFGDPALKLQTLPSPAAPSNLAATAISPTEIDLTWSDNSDDETGFIIERSLDNSNWNTIATVEADSTSYPDSGLSPNRTYFYRLRAVKAGLKSGVSNTASATTFSAPPLNAPSDLDATLISPTEIRLSWSDNSNDETEFQIERSPDGEGEWQTIAAVEAGVTVYDDYGLVCGTAYYYRVRAYRAGDETASEYSNVAGAETMACLYIYLPLVMSPEANGGN